MDSSAETDLRSSKVRRARSWSWTDRTFTKKIGPVLKGPAVRPYTNARAVVVLARSKKFVKKKIIDFLHNAPLAHI